MGEKHIKVKVTPRPNIKRIEKAGECFKKEHHYFLVRENDVLHVGDEIVNTLFDNHITNDRVEFGEVYNKISRKEFNRKLNETIFALDIYREEYKQ